MAPHVFAYRRAPGVPPRIGIRGLPDFGHGQDDKRYRFIEDDDVAADLREYSQQRDTRLFRIIEADELAEVLETASGAVDAIESGEYDDVLDLLLLAEREVYDNRVTVIDAIGDRKREIEEQRQVDSDDVETVLHPEEVTPIRE